jgi:CxC2 like cysteine cluster associated with KDZ transposases
MVTKGIKAAQATNSRNSNVVHRRGRSMSLQSVQEDPGSPENAGQLPTPRETPQPEGQSSSPVILDTLFDQSEIPTESDAASTGRTRTAASGNPLLTVVDRSGVFEMELIFCICSGQDDTEEQLLRADLFPATFRQIETLFTFSVLKDFLADNLECKTTAQQYYSKLQSMTSKMFPNSVPVCSSSIYICTYVNLMFIEPLQATPEGITPMA